MVKCPVCFTQLADGLSSCTSCGAQLQLSVLPTAQQEERQAAPNPGSNTSSSKSVDGGRFVPGTVIAGRYRIVGLLGRGGMGEVYRAEDLKLNHPVALKFLPVRFSQDAVALARFHREVRVARQIAHPNVCRVYDIGEVDGHHFITMEYIDGEDLASLLRRIGHLPAMKATEIARQVCAGLAAAHDLGVLHRDLKPANVMLDGRGKARLTDFGLAGLSSELHDREKHAGTPAYMAPEQIAGQEATIRSDIYSLGLVLYEIYTGKRVFDATTLQELMQQRQTSTPTSPSLLIKDLDPLVEKIVLRCLENDPQKRPASALQVAIALPGGDPLAAALAAGETPSPEMVAAAPKEGALRPPVAIACLAGVLTLITLLILLSGKTQLFSKLPLFKSPEVLAERAATISQRIGYRKQPVDTAYAFEIDYSYLEKERQKGFSQQTLDRLSAGQPLVLYFWYRQSPRYLEPQEFRPFVVLVEAHELTVSESNPPMNVSGMIYVVLDPRGRLVKFIAVPPQVQNPDAALSGKTEWPTLFSEAGLDIGRFSQVESKWLPPGYADERRAWQGFYPDHPDIPIRIEAASYRGMAVYFQIISPWEKPSRQEEDQPGTREMVGVLLLISAFVAALGGAAFLARRNLRLGRSDRRGAYRLVRLIFWVSLAGSLLSADHSPTLLNEMELFMKAVTQALLYSCFLWLFYIALEPYVRRQWPGLIISWSRLVAGGFRDPMVGRDVLIGGLLGLAQTFVMCAATLTSGRRIISLDPFNLRGTRSLIGGVLAGLIPKIAMFGLFVLLLLFLFYVLLRTKRRAILALFLLDFVLDGLFFASSTFAWIAFVFVAMLMVISVARFGLLAVMTNQVFFFLSFFYPLTSDFSAWYAPSGFFAIFIMLALSIYGFYISLAGQPLFRTPLLTD
jgi:Protein kinase domain